MNMWRSSSTTDSLDKYKTEMTGNIVQYKKQTNKQQGTFYQIGSVHVYLAMLKIASL